MLLPCLLDQCPTRFKARAPLPARLFVFGSLMDPDLLAVVLDRDVGELTMRPARILGFRRRRAHGESYPVLQPCPDGIVEGLLIEGLDLHDLDRLQYYETADYRLERFDALCDDDRLPAHVFVSTGRLEPSDEGWDLGAWQVVEKPGFLPAAAALMAHYGRTPLSRIDEALWAGIKEEAAAAA
jgi:hypothetical protein